MYTDKYSNYDSAIWDVEIGGGNIPLLQRQSYLHLATIVKTLT